MRLTSRFFVSGSIPAELSRLVALKRLDMSYNRLTGKCSKAAKPASVNPLGTSEKNNDDKKGRLQQLSLLD